MKKQLNRRLFLRGLGGACVAAPFLSSVAERAAKAQGVPAAGPPKRLIVMFTHYGCLTTKFFPQKSHGALTAADLTGTTIEPLAPFVDKLLIPRGIRAMNEWTSGMSRGQGNDPHTQIVGSYFTCQPVTPNSNDPFDFDMAKKFNAKPIGPSLDHIAAKQLSPDGTPLFMRVSNRNDSPQGAISYSGPEELYPGLGLPSQVYEGLTGLFGSGGGGPVTPDDYAAVKGKSILDLVKDDLETLERFDMSQSDKMKLAAWKELLDTTGTTMATAMCNEEVAMTLGAVVAGGGGGGMGDTVTAKASGSMYDTADVFSNLAVLAAVCNANPVIFLKYPGNYVFSGLGLNLENHSASHRLNNANMSGTCVSGVLGMLQTIDTYYATKFAHLVNQLNLIDEGDGKVLDNCAAVWFQEMSDGNAHNLNNLPVIQAGSAGGYFKTGWAVNVVDGAADMSRGNSESQCQDGGNNMVNGVNQSTGTPAEIGNAPINKYFCNLLNAIGVKAGTDGFPAEGGTQEVTHFGMYDRTEDFVGGGNKPAMISSPGGFESLKAGAV
jgi:hypothetical protein